MVSFVAFRMRALAIHDPLNLVQQGDDQTVPVVEIDTTGVIAVG